MNVAIVGSRTFRDRVFFERVIDGLLLAIGTPDFIISGGATGADSMAKNYADAWGIPTIIYEADWEKYGKPAGYIRNKDIVKKCNVLIAFWDYESKGTRHSIELAKQYNKKLHIIDIR